MSETHIRVIRVLCVDDHRLMREGIVRVIGLQPDMSVIAEASHGEEAVEQFLGTVRCDVDGPPTSKNERVANDSSDSGDAARGSHCRADDVPR